MKFELAPCGFVRKQGAGTRVPLAPPMTSSYSHHAPNLEHAFLTRRQMLQRVGMGFGSMALGSVITPQAMAATMDPM